MTDIPRALDGVSGIPGVPNGVMTVEDPLDRLSESRSADGGTVAVDS